VIAVLPQVPLPVNLVSVPIVRPSVFARTGSGRKRVVFDTTIPSIAPVTVAAAQAAPVPPAIAEASAKARVREAFAQIRPDIRAEASRRQGRGP